MDQFTTLSSLNLFTLVAVLVIAIGGALWFFRKRENRHPMGKNEGFHGNIEAGTRSEDPPRARDVRN